MKKMITLAFVLAYFLCSAAYAIVIVNNNSKSIKYSIADAATCFAVEYTKGELSPGGQLLWTENTYYHPEKVCVRASGWSSSVGIFERGLNNTDTCKVVIEDAGFLKGIKSKKYGC